MAAAEDAEGRTQMGVLQAEGQRELADPSLQQGMIWEKVEMWTRIHE